MNFSCTTKDSSPYDLYLRTLAGTNGSIQKGSPRNSPLHSVRAGEDHIHKGENFHPRVVNCVSACTTITDKILTLSFFLLFFPAVLVLVLHCFYHHTVFDFDWFYFIFGILGTWRWPTVALWVKFYDLFDFEWSYFIFEIWAPKWHLSAQVMSWIEFQLEGNHWLFLTSI